MFCNIVIYCYRGHELIMVINKAYSKYGWIMGLGWQLCGWQGAEQHMRVDVETRYAWDSLHQLPSNHLCEPSLRTFFAPSPSSRAMYPSSVTSRKRALSILADETESVRKRVKNTNAINDEQAVIDGGHMEDIEEGRYDISLFSLTNCILSML